MDEIGFQQVAFRRFRHIPEETVNARMVSFCFAILNTNYLEPNNSMDVGQALTRFGGFLYPKRRPSAAAERWKSQIHRQLHL